MQTFLELQDLVTSDARKFLDFVWDYYLAKGDWPTSRVVFGAFEKEKLFEDLRKLDGSLVREFDAPNGQKAFQLPLLGILCTSAGEGYRSLLRRYAEYLRDVFFHQSGIDTVKHDEVQSKLNLSAADTAVLGRLVFAGFLQGNGGYQPNFTEWGSSLPAELENFPSSGLVDAAVNGILDKMAATSQAVFLADRISAAGKLFSGDSPLSPALRGGYSESPTVFISYSHDSKEHKMWMLEFAQHLHLENIDVIFDQWDLGPGDDVVKFMERSVVRADRVLMICTEPYVTKVNEGKGGAGYEGTVVTGELIKDLGSAKFIPIVRQAGTHLLPTCVSTRAWINLSVGGDTQDEFKKLVSNLRREPPPTKPQRRQDKLVAAEGDVQSGRPNLADSKPSLDISVIVSKRKGESNDPAEIYEYALTLARARDIVNWRKLVAEKKGLAEEALKMWRAIAEKEPPKLKSDLPDYARRGVATQQTLFAVAIAGVESGEDKFNQQASLVYDLVKPKGWDRGGSTIVVDFPETNAFTFQAVLGAMCIYSYQHALAIDLATQRIASRRNTSVSGPLFLDHGLTAWPLAFETNAKIAWKFLLDLPDLFPWLVTAFSSGDSFRECLNGYFLLLAWLEFLDYLKKNLNFDGTQKIRLDIPPLFLKSPLFPSSARRLLQDRQVIASYGSRIGVPIETQLEAWPQWVSLFGVWFDEVFHDFEDSAARAEILNFAADIHR